MSGERDSDPSVAITDQIEAITQALVNGKAEDFNDYHRLCGMIEGLRRAMDLFNAESDNADDCDPAPFRFN